MTGATAALLLSVGILVLVVAWNLVQSKRVDALQKRVDILEKK
jgi:hypothetical protein